jgi:outer membrane protein assembly factor BamB
MSLVDSKTAGRLAPALAALALVVMARFGNAADVAAAGGARAAPSPADLAGTWVAVASHDGETATVALHLEAAAGGQLQVRWSTPVLHIWELPLGSATIYGNELRIGRLLRLAYDGTARTLSGALPAVFVPVYDMPVTFHRARLERTPRAEVAAPVAVPVWTFDAGAPVWADLALADDVLYVGTDGGRLHALAARTGKPLWEFRAGGAIRARPTVAAGDAFVRADDGFLYKVNATTGAQRWRVRVEPPVERLAAGKEGSRHDYRASAATLAGGRLYLGTDDGHVLALDPVTGARLWDFPANGAVASTPAVDAERVYFGSFDGHVYAVDAASGQLLWNHDTGAPVTSTPALHEGRVIIGSRSYDLLALDGASGKPVWTRYIWFSWVESSAAIFGGAAYVGSSDAAKLFSFDARSGRRLWELDAGGCAWGQPAVSGTRVFIGTVGTQNYLIAHRATILAVERATGQPAWRYPLAAPAGTPGENTEYGFAASPALAVGTGLVYIGGLDGRVLAFAQ